MSENAEDVTDKFESEFAIFQEQNAAFIQQLEAEVGELPDDFHWDQVDALKGSLSADAANQCSEDAGEQEAAIAAAEQFVTDNISNTATVTIALALWLNGLEEGEKLIREACQPVAPAPGE